MLSPLKSCHQENCAHCEVQGSIQCHFRWRDLGFFYAAVTPSLLLGAWGIYRFYPLFLIPWFMIFVVFLGIIEEAVLCSHCPLYNESGKLLRCWANFGVPKIWKYRPGPMSPGERKVLYVGLLLVWGLPLGVYLISLQVLPGILFIAATIVFFLIVKRNFCPRCINLACPFNAMSERERRIFLENNPDLKRAFQASIIPEP